MSATLDIEDVPGCADFRALARIDGIGVDLRYAGPYNFVGRDLYSPYDCAWLHVDAAAALARSVAWLADERPGWTVRILDALRPQRVQQALWEALAGTPLQMYLADPARGSLHSFGMALDLTLLDAAGREVDMGSAFDEMSERSHPVLEAALLARGQLSAAQIANRQLLRDAMAHGGFQGIGSEWWHFDLGERDLVRQTYRRVL